ncbi:melanocyte-stimulating hormone receptor-like [Actinia tenebrosa]|uniref:Melanocyte-stimulating hormone receptor-like n=1 Tax=Actinia tenebrosa TaxID=6105 RepID=A0A6P8HZG9_ACTTE|nr:melanocyte-stimulating hormone receptor-like [Actinia tenebrosa]
MNRTELVSEKKCFGLFLGIEHQDTTERVINILLAVLNFPTSLFAVVENFILILAIWKNAQLHKPSFALLGCLAFSDLLTGLVSQPCLVAYGIAKHYKNWTATCNATILTILSIVVLSGVSVSTLTAISIDRFLALHYYEEIITVPRVLVLFTGFWPVFLIVLIPRILNELIIFTILLSTGCTISLIIILVCYWKIYKITEKHRSQIQDLERAMQHANRLTNEQIKTGKKSSFSFFIVTVIYLGFSIPYLIFCILFIVIGFHGFVVQLGELSFTIITITASINPVVYCWRLQELRDAVKRQEKLIFKCLNRSENIEN